ncbi:MULTISPECIES: MFS transporter [Bosea]|uniref:MFS transporter n=1 Tax=Bosea TaxID=85413 RepID=UPI00214F9321|nr:MULTISPECIES: MFS transporter [Bosea]MCR4521445.1 MFS transporter [Bosea sp. 47.2.35]MDR6826871.1 putative MFS family arabinose efflux permease [Bosea robiniae]MDR6893581.1 putative MFS family arabinose efflux permease [Bosea sp. BE109]MDR7136720.1 putative MFS family arabinose efflux permease [Bosea sp. BE168]MDR7173419.1 putative MFS family arabinose efflux permease [Bosea sp. BE271]
MQPTDTTPLPTAFRRIGWSNLFAQFSEQIALAAAPLAAVLLLAAGPAETGWLQTAQTLPFLLLSIPAGLMVDRASRRRLMVGTEVLRAVSLLAIPLLLAAGSLNLPRLALIGALGAIGTVCYSVAAPAFVPSVVPRERLADANRWLELARSAAYAGGPALGGALVGWIGVSTAYGLAAGLSILAAMLLAGLPRDEAPSGPRRDLLHDLKEGARFVAGHDLLRPILMTAVFFNVSWFIFQAVYVAYAVQNLDLSATQVGVSLGIYGAGMIVGAILAPAIARQVTFGTLILLGPFAGLCAAGVMFATLWLPSVYLVAASFFLFGVGPIIWTISTMTLRQAVTPNAMLGRVSALIMTATFGARPIGAAIGASVAANLGIAACLGLAATGFLIQLLVIGFSRVPKLRDISEAV